MSDKPAKLMKHEVTFLLRVKKFIEKITEETYPNPQEMLDKLASGEQSIPGAWGMAWGDILVDERNEGVKNE